MDRTPETLFAEAVADRAELPARDFAATRRLLTLAAAGIPWSLADMAEAAMIASFSPPLRRRLLMSSPTPRQPCSLAGWATVSSDGLSVLVDCGRLSGAERQMAAAGAEPHGSRDCSPTRHGDVWAFPLTSTSLAGVLAYCDGAEAATAGTRRRFAADPLLRDPSLIDAGRDEAMRSPRTALLARGCVVLLSRNGARDAVKALRRGVGRDAVTSSPFSPDVEVRVPEELLPKAVEAAEEAGFVPEPKLAERALGMNCS